MIGSKIGQYEIVEELGKGGMSTVYRAVDQPQDRIVALQIVHHPQSGDQAKLVQFKQDVEAIAALKHPHILPIYDAGASDGKLYFTSQYIDGESVKQRFADDSLSPQDIIQIGEQVASALDYAHNHAIIHHDIKPGNIILAKDNTAYLTGFQLSSLTGDAPMMIGTPQYMSPEKGMAGEIDARTDIYSLGVMLFELLTGQLPYSGQTPMAVLLKHIQDPIPLATGVNSLLPAAVDPIFEKVLAKNPDDRYQLAGDFMAAFKPLQFQSVPTLKKRKIFISYRKLDKAIVHPIASLLEESDKVESVWIDMNLEGGQHWWNTILEEIRHADLVITALSDDYLDSVPCQREYQYALDLKKPMLPLRVGKLDYNRVARDLVQIQMVDFVDDSNDRQQKLFQAIAHAPVAPPLPDPLPTPPPIPLSILVEVEALVNQSAITRDDEHKIFSHLFDIINGNNQTERDSALKIVSKLQARRDISRGFYDKLQTLDAKSTRGGLFGFLRGRRKQ